MLVRWRHVAILAAILTGVAARTSAQTGQNVLVIGNALSRASDEIAQHYARARNIPSEQILRLNVPAEDEISREIYATRIESPIANWLTVHAAQDRILYIVLTKDVPLRIAGTGGQTGTVSSVDSELTLLYRRLWNQSAPLAGTIPNPYFNAPFDSKTAKPFTHRAQDLYLVARLDGYTVADVKALIDRGSQPVRDGVILLDARLEVGASAGNQWLADAAAALRKMPGWNDRVVLNLTNDVLHDIPDVLGHYSWGSNDRTAGTRRLNHRFNPGALGGEFVSTDARTFQEPPANWTVNGRPFGGSHQSLVGDLIREGITGVAGYVAEPYLSGTARPDVLFPAYVSGFNLIESFYLSLPSLSWQAVVIGDPLCGPFTSRTLPPADLNPPVDPLTELPAFLSSRRVEALVSVGAKPEAARAMAKAEVRFAFNDEAGARKSLEAATAADPSFVLAQLLLAQIYEKDQAWEAAIARYRVIIERAPKNGVALNNLAYALATRTKNLDEALELAKRAFTAENASPETSDTLAWVHHLQGNDRDAEKLIRSAVTRRPNLPEMRWHLAAILAGLGDAAGAKRELDALLKLDSRYGEHDDVKALQLKLGLTK